jgi:hypothetical protein
MRSTSDVPFYDMLVTFNFMLSEAQYVNELHVLKNNQEYTPSKPLKLPKKIIYSSIQNISSQK